MTIQDPHEAIAKARCPCGHLIIPLHVGACVVQGCGCEDGLPTALLRWHVAEAMGRLRAVDQHGRARGRRGRRHPPRTGRGRGRRRMTIRRLTDHMEARAARYETAAKSAGGRADRLAYGSPGWARAAGLEAYYTGKAERCRIAAAVIRETRQGKP